MVQALVIGCCVLICCITPTFAELVLTTSITRHGNRAPDPGIIDTCPLVYPNTESIINTFHAIPAGLTRVGLSQMYYSGAMLRDNYGSELGLLSADWRYDVHAAEFEFRARGQYRHQQSSSAQGNGLFPIGTGFESYPNRGQPIAIKSFPAEEDSALHTPAPECKARATADDTLWTATVGGDIIEQKTSLIAALGGVCGSDILADPGWQLHLCAIIFFTVPILSR
jgi:hypothetical protein